MLFFRLVIRALFLVATIVSYSLLLILKVLSYQFSNKKSIKGKLQGQFLAGVCETSGGAFLKVGQILSTRYDLFSKTTLVPLQRLQDSLPPFNPKKIPKIIECNLGRKIEDIFEIFDLKPLASASIAQVHYARLKSDRSEVAVKILRPKIKRQYEADLFLLSFSIKYLKRLSWFKEIPLEEAFRQIAECLLQQTDFLQEAENNRNFQTAFNSNPVIKFPRLIEKYCTDEILTMEYLDGLIRIDEPSLNIEERKKIIVECLEALYQMIFVEGFIHSDLHPGNFFRYAGSRVAILDTGFVAKINPNTRVTFRDFFLSIVFRDTSNCVRIIINSALKYTKEFNLLDFESEVEEMLQKVSNIQAQHFQISKFVFGLFEIQRKYGLYSTPDFTLPILSLLVYEGTIKEHYPNLNFQKLAVPFLSKSTV